MAGFTEDCSYDTVFQIVAPDPAHRIASEGVAVLAHVPLCIQHCATNALMHLTDASYPNEFAGDRELTFHTTRSSGKKALLHHENRGQLTSTIPSKHADPNFFVFLIGSKVEELPSATYARPSLVHCILRFPFDPLVHQFPLWMFTHWFCCRQRQQEQNETILGLHQQLAGTSGGLELLSRTLTRMDTSGSGKLLLDEVHLALKYCGLNPTEEQLAVLQAAAGTTKCGEVNYRQILQQIPERA